MLCSALIVGDHAVRLWTRRYFRYCELLQGWRWRSNCELCLHEIRPHWTRLCDAPFSARLWILGMPRCVCELVAKVLQTDIMSCLSTMLKDGTASAFDGCELAEPESASSMNRTNSRWLWPYSNPGMNVRARGWKYTSFSDPWRSYSAFVVVSRNSPFGF